MKIGGIDVLDSVAADLERCADANRIGSTYLCGGPGASRRVSLGPCFRIFAFSSVTIPPGIISLRGGGNESILSRVSTISTTTGKSRDIRKRLAEWTLVECPNPKSQRVTESRRAGKVHLPGLEHDRLVQRKASAPIIVAEKSADEDSVRRQSHCRPPVQFGIRADATSDCKRRLRSLRRRTMKLGFVAVVNQIGRKRVSACTSSPWSASSSPVGRGLTSGPCFCVRSAGHHAGSDYVLP